MTGPDPLLTAACAAVQGFGTGLQTPALRVRDGGVPPTWGCSLVAHELLGWCASDKGITAKAECMAWRVHAAGHPAPDREWALAISADAS